MPDFEREPVSVDLLLLDSKNPRLPEGLSGSGPEALLQHMIDNYDLEEIAWSIAEHGYFAEEPLLTIVDPQDSDRRIVVEGNRRLATLLLLTDADSRRLVGAPAIWEELAEFSAEQDLATIPTHRYPERTELIDYLGFRHVSGLMPWTAEAKARYVFSLVSEHSYSFERAAKSIGSRSDAIRRNFVAWSVLTQSKEAGIDVSEPTRRFGVFYRALQSPGIRRYLDMVERTDPWLEATEDLASPLDAETGPERMQEFIGFVWGPTRVLRESRDLDKLARVLDDPGALAVLREERSLDIALDEMPADRSAVQAQLRLAYRHARRAFGEAHNFSGDDELREEAARLSTMVSQVVRALDSVSDSD